VITNLVSFDHCIICPSIYGLWLPLYYLLTITLPVLSFTACNYLFGIFWPLYCLFFHLRLVIITLVSFGHCIVCPSVYACDYHFGIFWPLYCLSFHLRLVITTLVSFDHFIICPSIYRLWLPLWYLLDHCIICPSIYGLWLPLCYLLTITLPVLSFTACDYLVGFFWPLHCLSFHLRLVIITLVSFGHCIVCPSVYGLWLPLWYLLTIVLSVLPFTACDYHFDIFWPLDCLSFHLRLVITSLVSFDHCIVCPSIYGLWSSLW
jgi:hypothetical protein